MTVCDNCNAEAVVKCLVTFGDGDHKLSMPLIEGTLCLACQIFNTEQDTSVQLTELRYYYEGVKEN